MPPIKEERKQRTSALSNGYASLWGKPARLNGFLNAATSAKEENQPITQLSRSEAAAAAAAAATAAAT